MGHDDNSVDAHSPQKMKKRKSIMSGNGSQNGKRVAEIAKDTTPPPKKKGSFWNDDESAPNPPEMKTPPADQINHLVKQVTAPPHFFNVQTLKGQRITIIDKLGDNWRELLCYNWDLRITMHLKAEDLFPRDAVNAATLFLQEIS